MPALLAAALVLILASPLPAAAPAAAPSAPSLVQKDARKKAPKGVHRNSRFGFQFRTPKKWTNIPLKAQERWLGAKFLSDTVYRWSQSTSGWTESHQAVLTVIVLPLLGPEEPEEPEKPEEIGAGKGDEDDADADARPYSDYDDFLTRTFKGGDLYQSAAAKDEIGGVRVTKVTYLTVAATDTGPKTIETWIYHTDDVDYAVQVVGLTTRWKRISTSLKRVRESFELIEPDDSLAPPGLASDAAAISRLDLAEGTPEERRSKALTSQTARHARMIAMLPEEGWTHKLEGRVLVLSSVDKKASDQLQRHSNGLLDWLDDNYGYLRNGGHMRAPIIRICRNRAEANAYANGADSNAAGYYGANDLELVAVWGTDGWGVSTVRPLNRQIYGYWMAENNGHLADVWPGWIDYGLREMIELVYMDKKKPSWRFGGWAPDEFRAAAREGQIGPVRDLFTMTEDDYAAFLSDRGTKLGRRGQAAMLIRYLASPRMRRGRGAEGLLDAYLRNMIAARADVERECKEEFDKARDLLAEKGGEQKYFTERQRIFADRQRQIVDRTFQLTFADWTDRDWAKFTREFNAACGIK